MVAAHFAGDAGECPFPFLSISFRVRVQWDSVGSVGWLGFAFPISFFY
jgi:hypothetical protein